MSEEGKHRGGKDREKTRAYSKKFRIMLEVIAHPDGGNWTGTKIERATRGKVISSYFSSLRDGHIDIPRVDKIEAISEAMGIPPQLWFRDVDWWDEIHRRYERGEDVRATLRGYGTESNGGKLSKLLNRLFETKVNESTEKPFTNEEVSRHSNGILSEEDVEALRSGKMANPTWGQILALCDVFGIDPSYWSDRKNPWASPAVSRAFEEEEAYVIFQNSLGLSDENRSMLRLLSEHFKREKAAEDKRNTETE